MNNKDAAAEVGSSVFADMDPVIAASLLSRETPENIQLVLGGLPPEEDLIIASHLACEARPETEPVDSFEHLLGIDGSIEQIMIAAFGAQPPQTTVAGTLDYVVRIHPSTTITYIYVVDSEGMLQGVVAMRDLLLARPGQTLEEIMNREPFAFTPDVRMPEAVNAALARRHRLYPVVDEAGILIGLVYGWKLFEYVAT